MFHQRDGRHEGREERLHDRREEFEERLHGRREALEERRFGHGREREHSEERGHGRQREHSEERGHGRHREHSEERGHGRHEEHSEERRHGRREEHSGERRHERYEEHRRDPVQPQYSPPSGGFNRADFVSDEDFKRMMHGGGEFAKPLTGGDHIRPEDFGEWDRQRPPQNAGYQASYLQQSEPSGLRFSEAPMPPIPFAQRTSGYESGAYSQPSHNQYSFPESLDPRYGSNVYAPPAGAPGAPSSYAPAGGYAPPPGAPPPARYGYEASSQGGSSRGAASDYYNGPSPGQSAQSYLHTPDNATTYGDSPNPPRYQPHPSGGFNEENYKSHFSAHAQAYGSGYDDKPMANDDIGAAAAIEALKITAANNQLGDRQQQGGRPQGGFHPDANAPHATPSVGLSSGAQHSSGMGGGPGGKPQGRPQNAEYDDEDEEPAAKPQAPAGGGGVQDKIIALAMAQAGKLFDKKGGGDEQGKSQAMQSAAGTAMRLMGEYKSTGKVNMQPGEMQKLMGLAMTLF